MIEFLGVAALLFGLFFGAVGVVGVIRLPDVLTRLHASGKVATLGLFGLLLGAGLLMPSSALRLLALGLFVLMTNPVATHAIAASVHRREEIAQNLAQELIQDSMPDEAPAFQGVDVTALISRSRIQDIIDAQERASRQRAPDSRNRGDQQ